ncbi:hypothetical protein BH09PSE5_BH09PSE5_28540 [soil metagenome]
MNARPLMALRIAAIVTCLCLGACATGGALTSSPKGAGAARTPTGEAVDLQTAASMIAPGSSPKADITAALGPAIIIPFDTGYEVWVYRWPGADATRRTATELVILFNPSGLATKVRTRPGYAAEK